MVLHHRLQPWSVDALFTKLSPHKLVAHTGLAPVTPGASNRRSTLELMSHIKEKRVISDSLRMNVLKIIIRLCQSETCCIYRFDVIQTFSYL
jgi:hypothetical protein